MSRRSPALPVVLLIAAACAGCGGKKDDGVASAAPAPELSGVQARPVAPVTASAVARIADIPAARERLGFVDLGRLEQVREILPPATVMRTVLREGAGRVEALPTGAVRTAIQVGDATVLRGPRLPGGAGVPSGSDGAVLGGPASVVGALQDPEPQENVIFLRGAATTQSCLGDTVAQTTRRVPGDDEVNEVLGVGLRPSATAPADVELVVCYVPLRLAQIDRAITRIRRLYGDTESGSLEPVITEQEFGEVTAMTVSLPAAALPAATVQALLGGGDRLLALVDR